MYTLKNKKNRIKVFSINNFINKISYKEISIHRDGHSLQNTKSYSVKDC